MTSMTINLDPVAVREATAQAIMGILTPDMQSKLIQQSISALLSPSTNSWDRGKSPLQNAFDMAVGQVANEIAREHIKGNEEIAAKLRELVRATADKVLSADQDKMAERMADAFVASIKKNDY